MFERQPRILSANGKKRPRERLLGALGGCALLALASASSLAGAPIGEAVRFPGTIFQGYGDVRATDVAVAPNGDLIVVGTTEAAELPATDASSHGGYHDAFVARFDAKLRSLIWLIYLGGSDQDHGDAVALDASGNVYVAGTTSSSDFPTTSAYDATDNGNGDAFVAKLAAADGSHLWVTYLGGTGGDSATDIVVDGDGRAIVVGSTGSNDFPTVSSFDTNDYIRDAFVTRFAANGASLELSSYYGSFKNETAVAVDVDAADNIYVGVLGLDHEVMSQLNEILKISGSAKTLTWSLTLDSGLGSGYVYLTDIAVTGEGVVAFAGEASSDDFNITIVDPWQGTPGGDTDLFVGKLQSNGSAIDWSTFLGGSAGDYSASIALTSDEKVWVGGTTDGGSFPLRRSYFPTGHGLVSLLAADGQDLLFSTVVGGSYGVGGFHGIALASDEVPVLAGVAYEVSEVPITGLLPYDPDNFSSQTGLLLRLEPLASARFLPRRSVSLPPLEQVPDPFPWPFDLDGDGINESHYEIPDRSLDIAWGNVVLDRHGDGRDLISVGIGTLDGARVLGGLDQDGDGELELIVEDPRQDAGTAVGWLLDTGDEDVDLVVVGRGGPAGALLVDLDGDGEQEVVASAPHLADGAVARIDLDQDSDQDVLLIGGLPRAYLDIDNDGEREVIAERGGTAGTVSTGSLESPADGDDDVIFLAGTYAFARDLDGNGIPELIAENGAAAAGTLSEVAPVVFVGGTPLTTADLDDDEEPEVVVFDSAAAEGTFDPIDALDGTDGDADVVFVGGAFRGLADIDGDREPELLVEDSGGTANTFGKSDGLENPSDGDTDLIAVRGSAVAVADLDDDGELEILADGTVTAGTFLDLDGVESPSDGDTDVVFAGGAVSAFGDFDGDWEIEVVAEDGAASSGTFDPLDGAESTPDSDADVIFVAGNWRAVRDLDDDGEIEILSEDSGLGSAASAADGIENTPDSDPDVVFVREPFLTLRDLDDDGEPEIVVEDGGLSAPSVNFSGSVDGDSDKDRVAIPTTAGWRVADLDGDGETELVVERTGGTAGALTAVDGVEVTGDGDGDVIFVGGVPHLVVDADGDSEVEVVVSSGISAGTVSLIKSLDGISDGDADVIFVGGTVRGAFDADGDYEFEIVVENGSGGATSRYDEVDGLSDPDADVIFTGGAVRRFTDIDNDGELEAIAEDSAASPGASSRYDGADGDADADVIYVAGILQGDLDLDGDGEIEIAVTDPDLAGGTAVDPDFWDGDTDADGILVGTDTSPGSPTLTLTAPNGGGSVTLGNPLTITWSASGFAGTVRIELSRDGGTTWETLFASTSNDGSEVWTSDGAPTASALVRITSRNLATPVVDDSNAVFTLL